MDSSWDSQMDSSLAAGQLLDLAPSGNLPVTLRPRGGLRKVGLLPAARLSTSSSLRVLGQLSALSLTYGLKKRALVLKT